MKKKHIRWMIITVIAVVLISNFTVIGYLFHENFTYSNYDGSFSGSEEDGGRGAFKMVENQYRFFLQKHPIQKAKDSTLYRTFTIKPLRFWQWSDYLFCPERFRLPYKASAQQVAVASPSFFDRIWDYL